MNPTPTPPHPQGRSPGGEEFHPRQASPKQGPLGLPPGRQDQGGRRLGRDTPPTHTPVDIRPAAPLPASQLPLGEQARSLRGGGLGVPGKASRALPSPRRQAPTCPRNQAGARQANHSSALGARAWKWSPTQPRATVFAGSVFPRPPWRELGRLGPGHVNPTSPGARLAAPASATVGG